jgi:hypothetical protein
VVYNKIWNDDLQWKGNKQGHGMGNDLKDNQSKKSMSLYVQRVISFLYAGSYWHFCILTNMHQKPLACISLHMDMVPMAYQCEVIAMSSTETVITVCSSDILRK